LLNEGADALSNEYAADRKPLVSLAGSIACFNGIGGNFGNLQISLKLHKPTIFQDDK
jgi:hypothetical protein